MSYERLNSINTDAQLNRLDVIRMRAQTVDFKANGGQIESVGVTRSVTLTVKRQHQLQIMQG